jgi:hypothetical protein
MANCSGALVIFKVWNIYLKMRDSINDLTPKEFIILHENTPETLVSVV